MFFVPSFISEVQYKYSKVHEIKLLSWKCYVVNQPLYVDITGFTTGKIKMKSG